MYLIPFAEKFMSGSRFEELPDWEKAAEMLVRTGFSVFSDTKLFGNSAGESRVYGGKKGAAKIPLHFPQNELLPIR